MYSEGMSADPSGHRERLRLIARRAMLERGLDADFSSEALAQASQLDPGEPGDGRRDLRHLPWCSIDNDDSRDLDQLTVAEDLGAGRALALVAIADVDRLVRAGDPIDRHAGRNTTSVYTAAAVFPMLPERLSTDLTSLNAGEERAAIVVEMTVGSNGEVTDGGVSRAVVLNHAKLAYNAVAAWLAGESGPPPPLAAVPGLDGQLRLQDDIAHSLEEYRRGQGALDFDTVETTPVFDDGRLIDLAPVQGNRAKEIIEHFMVAANGVTARFLEERSCPSIRRVVRSPRRWDRIVELASVLGETLPPAPDARALQRFLAEQRAADPLRFPDLSLSVIKLLGAGEYALERPGEQGAGHFGLAVQDYAHSTAPNRRYPDLVTQRLLKAALAGAAPPYAEEDLARLAAHCTTKEDEAAKVERLVQKSAAALLLEGRLGQRFDALVTGAAAKGTWVRVLQPPAEGRLVIGEGAVDVGDRIQVRLAGVDVDRGYIDFTLARR